MKKIIWFALIALLVAQGVMAAANINVIITPKKTEFREGELLAFDYSISSGTRQDIVYTAQISCPQAPVPVIERKAAVLQAGAPIQGEFKGAIVNSETEPQTCTASVRIFSPETKIFKSNIRITALPTVDFNLLSCTDSSCTQQKRSFLKGSTIYLRGNAAATASVTSPDGSTQRVALPGSFTASQSGEYTVEISATKSGFKPFASTASLFVVEQAFTVPYAEFSSKVGQAVLRPVFKAPSALAAPNTAAKAPAATAKKTSIKLFFSRVTGYFTKIF